MSRTKRGAGKTPTSQDIKSITQDVKALRKRQREMLSKAGKDIRGFRSEVARLKKLGVVSKRQDVRHQQPTRYMLSKVRNFADVLSGNAIPIRAPKDVREKYVERGLFKSRGNFLIVPKEDAKQRTQIKKGLIENIFPLGRGELREIVLPYRVQDMAGLVHELKNDPTLDRKKSATEMFGFKLYGHKSRKTFVDAQELIDHIETKYKHLFKGMTNRDAFRHFVLVRFKGARSAEEMPDEYFPEEGKQYSGGMKPNPKGRTDGRLGTKEKQKLERDRLRKEKARRNETENEARKRLERQKLYQARYRQRKFEEK